jgi:N-acetylglucosamine-6-phosphate deacetylase
MQRIISAKYVFDGSKLLTNSSLVIDEAGKIIDMVEYVSTHAYLGDGVISHGFVDLQVNGCGGVTFNDDISQQTLETMYQTWFKYGTTKFLPTLITSAKGDIDIALDVVAKWVKQYGSNRGVFGIHIEGPFISTVKKGIHPKSYIRTLDNDTLNTIKRYAKQFSILMTVAPESISDSQVKELVAAGVIVSLGHTNTNFTDAQSRFLAGASNVTHLFNAMSGIKARDPGLAGAVLLNNNVYVGIIADLLHVDKANILLAKQLKQNKLYLVTDAVMPVGTSLTKFNFAGVDLQVVDNKCLSCDNGTLGGAYLTMPQAVMNCIKECEFSILDSLKMAVTNPLNAMKLDSSIAMPKAGTNVNDLIYLDLTNFSCGKLI